MAVERKGKSITLTADADAYSGVVFITGLTFQVAGGTAAQRLRLTDTGGSVICDYLVEAATDNADLWAGREGEFYHGLLVEDYPAAGTSVLTVITG